VHELGQQRGRAGDQERDQLGDGDTDVGAQRGQDREGAAGPLFLLLLAVRLVGGVGRAGALAGLLVSLDSGFPSRTELRRSAPSAPE
jgi:hypothetical protein